jgi:hypothetical protein
MDKMIGSLDRHSHGCAKHRFGFGGSLQRLRILSMNEGEDLLHDPIENNPAAEGGFNNRCETGCLIKRAVPEA